MPTHKFARVPSTGERIAYEHGTLKVPHNPIIPYVEGDGTGADIWRASVRVFDAAIEKAFGGERKVAWMEVFAGEKAFTQFQDWLPQETVDAMQDFRVSIKGPLTTPVGGGIRSLNVTLRQVLDLYACIRPVRYFEGVGSPMKEPEKLNIVVFRENTEDVYAGIEWKAGSPEAEKLRAFIEREFKKEIRARLRHRHQADVRVRLQAPDRHGDPLRAQARPPLGHADAQGQHHEVHRGRVPRLGLRGGAREVRGDVVSEAELLKGGPRRARRRGDHQGPHRRLDVPAAPAAPR